MTLSIISELVNANLSSGQVDEIVTTNNGDQFSQALESFCDSVELAFRIIESTDDQLIDKRIYISPENI